MALTLDQWEARLRNVGSTVVRLALPAVDATAVDGVNVAQGVVPVITGQLQSSISIDRVASTGKVVEARYSAKAPYAKFVEEGTVHFGPRRYMRSSAIVVTPKLKRRAVAVAIKALTR